MATTNDLERAIMLLARDDNQTTIQTCARHPNSGLSATRVFPH